MSELNEQVTVTVDDTPAITVQTPLVENFTAENAAPKASAVGAALALKADRAGIMEDVVININDETHSDNQGKILLYGDMIPTESGAGKPSLTEAIQAAVEDVEERMVGDQIPTTTGGDLSVTRMIEIVREHQYGDMIFMSDDDDTMISTRIEGVDARLTAVEGKYLKTEAQELTTEQKAAVRANIGLGAAAQKGVVNDLTTSTGGEYVLDAAQGYQLKSQIDALDTKVTDHINSPLLVSEVGMAAAQAVAAGDSASGVTIDVPAVTGYRPIGIVGFRTSGTNASWLNFYRTTLDIDDETGSAIITFSVRNEYGGTGTGTANMTAYFRVLYMKTAAAG